MPGDIIVLAGLGIAVLFAVRALIKKHKKGGCSGDCGSCGGCSSCRCESEPHAKQKKP